MIMLAIGQGFPVLTHDPEDFEDPHDLVIAAAGHHAGILIVRFDNDPRHNRRLLATPDEGPIERRTRLKKSDGRPTSSQHRGEPNMDERIPPPGHRFRSPRPRFGWASTLLP
jgi:hypothetical protein